MGTAILRNIKFRQTADLQGIERCSRLCVAGGLLRRLNNYTVSWEKRVLFFSTGFVLYAYATSTSASAEVFVSYVVTGDLAGDTNTFKFP